MPKFDIEVEICLGYSHCGGVYNDGCGEVELSDNEVEQLVTLMKEKGTSDIIELELEEKHPEIYKKLDEAYSSLAYKAEEEHWLDDGYYRDECHNYEDADMIAFLKEKNRGILNTMRQNLWMRMASWMKNLFLMQNVITFIRKPSTIILPDYMEKKDMTFFAIKWE